jgi:hypothetical protein
MKLRWLILKLRFCSNYTLHNYNEEYVKIWNHTLWSILTHFLSIQLDRPRKRKIRGQTVTHRLLVYLTTVAQMHRLCNVKLKDAIVDWKGSGTGLFGDRMEAFVSRDWRKPPIPQSEEPICGPGPGTSWRYRELIATLPGSSVTRDSNQASPGHKRRTLTIQHSAPS